MGTHRSSKLLRTVHQDGHFQRGNDFAGRKQNKGLSSRQMQQVQRHRGGNVEYVCKEGREVGCKVLVPHMKVPERCYAGR